MKISFYIAKWLAITALFISNLQLGTVYAQGTAFTYQGQLNDSGSPASGTYSLTFTLFKTNTSGVPIAGPVTNNAVAVTNGLFTVLIDFGPGTFTGETNWLEIGVETNGVSSFTTLAPRQRLTPAPYAIYAESANAAGISGTLSTAQLPSSVVTNGSAGVNLVGNFSGDGSGLTNVNAATAGVATNAAPGGPLASLVVSSRSFGRYSWTNTLNKIASGSNAVIEIIGSGLVTANGGLQAGFTAVLTNYFPINGIWCDFGTYSFSSQLFGWASDNGYAAVLGHSTNWTGEFYPLTNSAVRLWISGSLFNLQPNGAVVTVGYMTGPNEGDMNVDYYQYNGGAYLTNHLATLNCNSTVPAGAIYSWTNNLGTIPQYSCIVLTASGTTNFIPVCMTGFFLPWQTNGVYLQVNSSCSSSGWTNYTEVPVAVRLPIDGGSPPDLLIMQSVENATNGNFFQQVYDYWRTNFPNTDIVLCGTYPILEQNLVVPVENVWTAYMQAEGKGAFYDAIPAFVSYSNLVFMGIAADNTHLDNAGMMQWGADLWNWLALNYPNANVIRVPPTELVTTNIPTAGSVLTYTGNGDFLWSTLFNGTFNGNYTGNGSGLTNVNAATATTATNSANNFLLCGGVADGVTDNSLALSNALAQFGEITIPYTPNYFVISNLTLQSNQRIIGGYPKGRLKFAGALGAAATAQNFMIRLGPDPVNTTTTWPATNIVLQNLEIYGGVGAVTSASSYSSGTWPGTNGVWIDPYGSGCSLQNCFIHGFSGSGIFIGSRSYPYAAGDITNAPAAGAVANISGNLVTQCGYGYNLNGFNIQFPGYVGTCSADYTVLNSVQVENCVNGIYQSCGNITINGGYSIVCSNDMFVCAYQNDGHSTATGLLLNHAFSYGLICSNLTLGYDFIGCKFFYSPIYATNCSGISIRNGEFNGISSVSFDGGGANVVENNFCYSVQPTFTVTNGGIASFQYNTRITPSTTNGIGGVNPMQRYKYKVSVTPSTAATYSGITIGSTSSGSWGAGLFAANSLGYVVWQIPHGDGWKTMAADIYYYGASGSSGSMTFTNLCSWNTMTYGSSPAQVQSQTNAITIGIASGAWSHTCVTNSFNDDVSQRQFEILSQPTNGIYLVEVDFRSLDN